MRFLILVAVLAYAAAEPEPQPALPVGQRIEPTLPTISAGDINGAYAEAQVEVADTVRAAVDVDQQIRDKVTEIQESEAWRVVDTVKTVEARLDGAAAAAAPVIAKNFVRGIATPGVNYAIPQAYGAAPVAPVLQPGATVPNALAAASLPVPVPSAVRPQATAGPSVQATAPVASVVAAPASYPAGTVAPAVQSASPYVQSYNPYSVNPYAYNPYTYNPYSYNPYAANPSTYNPYAYNPFSYATNPYGYDSSVYTGYPGYLNNNPYVTNPYYQGLYNSPLGYSQYYKK